MLYVKHQGEKPKQMDFGTVKTNNNRFKNWYCNAGMDFLTVSHSGEIFGNVCRHSKSYGNVFKQFTLPTEPMICPALACYCASDLEIPKGKDKNFLDQIEKGIDGEWVAGIHKIGKEPLFSINWNLGKRCNYDCSYCPSSVHDNFSKHLKFDEFRTAFDKLTSSINFKKLKITFTGGEPTINPDYIQMVNHCIKDKRVTVFTNTNGTANIDKLLHLTNAGGLYISVHEEFTDIEKLKNKILSVTHNKNRDRIIVVKIMLKPGSTSLRNFALDLYNYEHLGLTVNVEPLVDKSNNNKILDYSNEEIDFIRKKGW